MNLTSASNRQVTILRKLNRKKYRYKEQLFLLEGARAVQQIIENGIIEIERLFFDVAQQYWQQEDWAKLSDRFEMSTLEESLFAEVTDTDNPQGVLALCEIPDETSVDALAHKKGIIIAFDQIQDPGNVGTMIRSAAWFGSVGMLAGKGTVDLFHPKVVRSTAGTTGTVPYRNSNLSEELGKFENLGWQIVLLDGSPQATDIRSFNPRQKTILVVGNEANGVDPVLFKENRSRVAIRGVGKTGLVESLNASIALSISLYALTP
jgi:TrmH family RNA methyltransferase